MEGICVQSIDTPRPASISAAARVPWWSRQGPGHARRHGKDPYILDCARRGVSHTPHPVTLYTFVYGVPSARASLAPSASRHYPSFQWCEHAGGFDLRYREGSDVWEPLPGQDRDSGVHISRCADLRSPWDVTRARNCFLPQGLVTRV